MIGIDRQIVLRVFDLPISGGHASKLTSAPSLYYLAFEHYGFPTSKSLPNAIGSNIPIDRFYRLPGGTNRRIAGIFLAALLKTFKEMPDTPNKRGQEAERGSAQNPKDMIVERRKAEGGQGNSKGDVPMKGARKK